MVARFGATVLLAVDGAGRYILPVDARRQGVRPLLEAYLRKISDCTHCHSSFSKSE
jgi:hypothetical protein